MVLRAPRRVPETPFCPVCSISSGQEGAQNDLGQPCQPGPGTAFRRSLLDHFLGRVLTDSLYQAKASRSGPAQKVTILPDSVEMTTFGVWQGNRDPGG